MPVDRRPDPGAGSTAASSNEPLSLHPCARAAAAYARVVASVETGRVLVVDDEPDVREAVEQALELEGHRVATAVDGLAALKRLGAAEFEAIVLDVLMPNLDRFEVCRRLRAAEIGRAHV